MKRFTESLMAVVLFGAASFASAVTLTTSVPTALPGTSSAAEPQLAGPIIEDELQAFSFIADGGTISGTVQSRVVRSSVDGTLDFYWRVMSDTSSAGAIQSFRLGNFYTTAYNANWRSDGSGSMAPLTGLLFAGSGGNVNFDFGFQRGEGLAVGSDSYFMFLDTDATTYSRSAMYDLTNMGQSQISTLFETFAPGTVPEPGSIALFGLGVAGLALARRRKLPRS